MNPVDLGYGIAKGFWLWHLHIVGIGIAIVLGCCVLWWLSWPLRKLGQIQEENENKRKKLASQRKYILEEIEKLRNLEYSTCFEQMYRENCIKLYGHIPEFMEFFPEADQLLIKRMERDEAKRREEHQKWEDDQQMQMARIIVGKDPEKLRIVLEAYDAHPNPTTEKLRPYIQRAMKEKGFVDPRTVH